MKSTTEHATEYPFADPANVAVITCCHVLEEGAEVCFVSHDEEDGMWQFLCGADHSEEEARVVGLGEVWRLDETVGQLADLPLGYAAARESKGARWQAWRQPEEEESEEE